MTDKVMTKKQIAAMVKKIERHKTAINGSERSLSPRMVGNQMGLAYAAGIRDQVVPSAEGKTP